MTEIISFSEKKEALEQKAATEKQAAKQDDALSRIVVVMHESAFLQNLADALAETPEGQSAHFLGSIRLKEDGGIEMDTQVTNVSPT